MPEQEFPKVSSRDEAKPVADSIPKAGEPPEEITSPPTDELDRPEKPEPVSVVYDAGLMFEGPGTQRIMRQMNSHNTRRRNSRVTNGGNVATRAARAAGVLQYSR